MAPGMPDALYSAHASALGKDTGMSESDDEVSDPDSAVVVDGEMPILSKESDAPSSSVLLEALSFYTDTVPVSHVPQTGLSLADKALGRTGSTLIQSSVSDSPLIARDLATARRRFLTPSLADDFGQVVDAASEVAQLTQPAPALAPAPRRLPIRGSRWLCSAFPSPGTGLMVTEADRDKLGLSSRTSSDVLVSDSALRLFETSAEKGLMTAGRMDSVLAALTSALSGGDPSRDPDPEREHFMIQPYLVRWQTLPCFSPIFWRRSISTLSSYGEIAFWLNLCSPRRLEQPLARSRWYLPFSLGRKLDVLYRRLPRTPPTRENPALSEPTVEVSVG